MEKQTLSVTEAGTALGCSRAKAYKMLKEGTFPVPVITVGGVYKVSRVALLRFIEGTWGHGL